MFNKSKPNTMTYTDNKGEKRDFNSTKNQSIKQKFVQEHIYCSVGSMVEHILKYSFDNHSDDAPFNFDDLENYNMYYDQVKEGYITDIEKEERLSLLFEGKELGTKEYEDAEEHYDSLTNTELEGMEVLEWYKVSRFLLSKLKEKREVVIDHENIWGRCIFGQAILLDSVISEICFDMEILEGQENEWSI